MNKSDKVLETIKNLKKPIGADDLKTLGMSEDNIRGFLAYLKKMGRIKSVGRGLYTATDDAGNTFTFELLFGFEIEAEYNTEILGNIEKSSYHTIRGCKKFGSKWFVERDGSLRTGQFRRGDTAEFISIPLPKSEVQNALKSFQKKVFTLAKKKVNLDDVLNFNDTTGAHVHISLLIHDGKQTTLSFKNNIIKLDGTNSTIKFVPVEFMKDIGKNFKKAVKKQMPSFYPVFMKRYYRHYAQKVVDKRRAYNLRTAEFNYTTQGGTIEYRSPNLTGIKTWNDFFKFYEILTTTLQDYFLIEMDKSQPFSQSFTNVTETEEEENTDSDFMVNLDSEGDEDRENLTRENIILETLSSLMRRENGGN